MLVPFRQISTSVLRNPTPVTRTLIVPTVSDLTAVLVNKDSLEMEQFVKVHTCEIETYQNIVILKILLKISISMIRTRPLPTPRHRRK